MSLEKRGVVALGRGWATREKRESVSGRELGISQDGALVKRLMRKCWLLLSPGTVAPEG